MTFDDSITHALQGITTALQALQEPAGFLQAVTQVAGIVATTGTFPVALTTTGRTSPLFQGIADQDCFHYANSEQVIDVPPGARLLASSSRVPVAALDYGDHCYTTQFHPEGSELTLGPIWQHTRPQLMQNYHANDRGDHLVDNFLRLVIDQMSYVSSDLKFANR